MTDTRGAIYTVGIADMKVANGGSGTIVTYALGSCLGITVYDPVARVGGLLHVMLPLSRVDKVKAQTKPFMFVDTGVPMLFREAYRLGAKKERITLKVAGGASILDDQGRFKIGERNYAMLRKILWKNGVLIESEDVGGSNSRTLWLDMETGRVSVRSNGQVKEL